MRRWSLLPAILLGLHGCTPDAPSSVAAPPSAAEAQPTDAWVGRWSGPEGTYLDIAGSNGVYEVTVMDLDAARTFAGSAAGARIEFRRDGTLEALRATNGDDTGMKWLVGKADCLTIKLGEGYCRD